MEKNRVYGFSVTTLSLGLIAIQLLTQPAVAQSSSSASSSGYSSSAASSSASSATTTSKRPKQKVSAPAPQSPQ